MNGWLHTTIGEQVTLQRGVDITKATQRPGTIPVVSSGGIASYHDTAMAQGPGVVLGRKGVVGSVYYIEPDYWPHDTSLWVKNFHGNDPRFVYYFFKQMAPELASMDVGSANPTLNRNHVHPIRISWPPLPEQRAIAHVLGTLDDKTELNRRMNQTLEEIARALFRSWFVDFDPVRAKADERQPAGMDAATAALFPSELEETEYGEIPKGWRVAKLGECIELAYGRALKHSDRRLGNVPVFGSNGRVGWHDERLAKGPGIIVGRKGNPGTVTWSFDDFFAIDITFFVMPKKASRSQHFLYFALQSQQLENLSADSAVPGLNRNVAYRNDLLEPSPPVENTFGRLVAPLFERIAIAEKESATLAELRDSLLPRLMSGEVRILEAEASLAAMSPS